ncbi:MAG TPA: aspartate kinase, partial [Vicinamibacterales bacterium]|nr:aspartate kinase [Vicinamibacterales bacterium]
MLDARVMKFGGTSVADAEAIRRLLAIVRAEYERGNAVPVVVVSAMAGVTDRLLALASAAARGERAAVASGVEELRGRHLAALDALVPGEPRARVALELNRHADEVAGILASISILRELSPRSLDRIASAGELLSSRLVAAALEAGGVPAVWIDARRTVVTDDTHGRAAPQFGPTCGTVRREIVPHVLERQVPVAGGFVGATAADITTTLGRGGSDYSASIIGAALGAAGQPSISCAEIQIWTDVDGMLTADPRLVDSPAVVPHLSFGEASELAYFGAKVLHPSTILPAVERDIPVRILNSRSPEGRGTEIAANPPADPRPVAALACKRPVTVIEVTSTRMLMAHGFLRRLFEVFERYQTAVDVVTTSEVSVSVTVDD